MFVELLCEMLDKKQSNVSLCNQIYSQALKSK